MIVPGSSRALPLALGAAAQLPGWQVEVLETLRGEPAWRQIYKANQYNDPPPDGYVYLLLRMRLATNFQAGEQRELYLQVTGDRLRQYQPLGVVPPEPALQTELDGGQQSTGWQAFLVADGEADLLLAVDELTGPYEGPPVYLALEEGAAIPVDPDLELIDTNQVGLEPRSPARIGEMVVSEDWELLVLQVISGTAAMHDLHMVSPTVDKPRPGYKYVLAHVAVRYIGDGGFGPETESIGHSNFGSVSMAAFDPVGMRVKAPSVYRLPEPILDARLYPGGRAEGWVIVEMPEYGQYWALVFTPSFDHDNLNTRYFLLS